jgi:hypothetical protein
MSFPTFTVSDLVAFSGREFEDYTTYADQALLEATVFLMLITQLTDWPTDPLEQKVAKLGILHWAESLCLEQPYREAQRNPFQSMNAGSVSWSKPIAYIRGNAQANALKGEITGIQWFDLAVQKLAKRTEFGGVYSNSIDIDWMEEVFVRCDHNTGAVELVGPGDMDRDTFLGWPDWSSDSWPADVNNITFGGGMRS